MLKLPAMFYRKLSRLLSFVFLFAGLNGYSQIDPTQNGAWYMYFWNTRFSESDFGLQGDIQYRNWNMGGDLEQLLIRGGINYEPVPQEVRYTLGYANITTGEFGDGTSTVNESRIYQEFLLWQTIGKRYYLNHRFRYEQRFVENQDFRTRYRYFLSMNIALNNETFEKGTYYLSFYNELFINGQKDIGDGNTVEFFDRNRLYGALGYTLKKGMRLQVGYMKQTVNAFSKDQWQIGMLHTF